jgi:hypothetical protein
LTFLQAAIRPVRMMIVPLALLLCCSCASRFKPTYPVKGQVLVGGKPAEGVNVRFISLDDPNDDLARPFGSTDAEGWFTVNTYKTDDGIPAGAYAVTLRWLPKGYRGPIEAGNKIPMRYDDPETSGFKVQIIKGENTLPPFEVEKKTKK